MINRKKNKNKNRNRNKNRNINGGKVIASGGFGCVFEPAIKCENEEKRDYENISKLMTTEHAKAEYNEIINIKNKLNHIPNYSNYFLLDNISICKPAKLTLTDLKYFKNKCTALPKDNITKNNINDNLDNMLLLNMPNGGLPVNDYINTNGSIEKLINVNNSLIGLLINGIIPMNQNNIYHCDIKYSNVLVHDANSIESGNHLTTRLIDWGLSTEYVPNKQSILPKTWKNRPLQFNVPFTVVIFTDIFNKMYSEFIENGGNYKNFNNVSLFVSNYISVWFQTRGNGHYDFINNIMYLLFGSFDFNDNTKLKEGDKHYYISQKYTTPYIVDYITTVLIKFTNDGIFDIGKYLDDVFIEICDIWGFITIYVPYLELFFDNYYTLTTDENSVFELIVELFMFLYTPRVEPFNIIEIKTKLNDINMLLIEINNIRNSYLRSTYTKKKRIKQKLTRSKSKLSASSSQKLYKNKSLKKKPI